MTDPAETLLRFFPKALLNFDVAPAGTTIGPLHALFTKVGQTIGQFQADVLLAQAQMTVQQASGKYLDAHGALYGLVRLQGEADSTFRPRILLALGTGKLTLGAIAAAVQLYFSTATYAHVVTTYDLQSNPSAAATTAYVDEAGTALTGLVPLDFVVALDIAIPVSQVFFAGRSYAGRGSYVIDTDPVTTVAPADARLVSDVNAIKAGGTHPVYRYKRYLVAHT